MQCTAVRDATALLILVLLQDILARLSAQGDGDVSLRGASLRR
jgi:hypothetical protein